MDLPQRRSRVRSAANPLVSLRSPLPLLVAGLGLTVLVIAIVTLPTRQAAPPVETENLTRQEALTIVADAMRSGTAAAQVLNQGDVRFDDGAWYVSVGAAQFHFTQRNHIVVADNPAAVQLKYLGAPATPQP